MVIEGNIVDIEKREIYHGSIEVVDGQIVAITRHDGDVASYIMLGFVDSHVHIESSMLTPANFGEMVIRHGTVGIVTDPHEIANVVGAEGIEYMLRSSESSPIITNFTIPSCVPATPFDVAGGEISADEVEQFVKSGRFVGLSEVMNIPGVLNGDDEVMRKLEVAREGGMVIDGHAPLLAGEPLQQYVGCGISTDHECSMLSEAVEKIECGMKIQLRDGSAAKNYEGLKQLIALYPNEVLFCTDDSHPHDVMSYGHITGIVKRAIADGFDLYDVLRIASLNPIKHYGLNIGELKVGDRADFIVVDDLTKFNVNQVYIEGELRYDRGRDTVVKLHPVEIINNFDHDKITVEQICHKVTEPINVIGIMPDEILTLAESFTPSTFGQNLESDIKQDIQKIVYINRYKNSPPVVAYCRGFGLKRGAIASSIAHDSHNILAVGVSDHAIVEVVNKIIEHKGGLVVNHDGDLSILPLPIAGIMSDKSGEEVAAAYNKLHQEVAMMGCYLPSPFMTLSFMALVVVPELKIGEKGLFRYSTFNWV